MEGKAVQLVVKGMEERGGREKVKAVRKKGEGKSGNEKKKLVKEKEKDVLR